MTQRFAPPGFLYRRMTVAHPLDRPIWSALTMRQETLAEIAGSARRYPADIAPFADVEDLSPAGFKALHGLMRTDQPAVLFTPDPLPALPDELEIVMASTGEQMVGTPAEVVGAGPEIVELGADDVPAMRALVELTRPGPFGPRTHTLGDFHGIKRDGRLAAMTGERMAPGNHTEMTAVCVHPEFRGRGYAQALLALVARRILARGETPFLHVFSDNASAIALYKRQGMTIRRRLHVTVLGRTGDNLKDKLPH
jgi:ribosomal protein S18 acetylase RimI-like enzyme